ncbi:ATP-binding protein [Sphaerisporangium sp. TRM90804]|uniref:ATP-binding protein n=1 Tax=Sphaerisporangium sp. TRM90804 TaxID=3031113 RepID=UPI002446D993|nr:ATP-binding protein [Sphaerisporangium sp. TRM90804]MDH2424811.1 ATP-binding protein [Sphaerisporangium sp. TRM90804]
MTETREPVEELLDAEWRADRLALRLNTIRAQRPPQLSHQGVLDQRIAAWSAELVARRAGNLVVVGDVGVGKTWSVWEALDRAVRAGWLGGFKVATSADWQDATAPPVDREQLRAMRVVDFLALDDLGSFRINDWQRECLLSVVDERWQHGLPTAITTNMRKLSEPLGDRLASRLRDGATVIALSGADRRKGR